MEKDIELILINISGEDRPGLTSALTEILAKYEANILISVRLTSITRCRLAYCSRPIAAGAVI